MVQQIGHPANPLHAETPAVFPTGAEILVAVVQREVFQKAGRWKID